MLEPPHQFDTLLAGHFSGAVLTVARSAADITRAAYTAAGVTDTPVGLAAGLAVA